MYALKIYNFRSVIFNIVSIFTSDVVVISFQKCGKTWLRVMLSHILKNKYNIRKTRLDSQRMTWFTRAPNILISHAGSTKNNNKLDFTKIFKNKKKIFLVRDPRDIVISLFHGSRTRDLVYKGSQISKFIRDEKHGFPKIIHFMNIWADEVKRNPDKFIIVKYEDMKKNINHELKRILNFINISVSEELIQQTAEFGSFNNMRKMEMNEKINDYRMKPGNKKDPNSFRTRKGKVGGYKKELNEEDMNYINNELKEKLDSFLGYKVN